MKFATVFFLSAAALAQSYTSSTTTAGTYTMTSTASQTSTATPNAVAKNSPSVSIALLSVVLGAAFL
jgi:hypothetical protein